MRILLAGGAGYIGSHLATVLLEAGHDVLIVDDFSNSTRTSIERIGQITGRSIDVVECDLADQSATRDALSGSEFDAVVHLAGLKAVGESVAEPAHYYRTNLTSTLNILDLMRERGVTKLVFSSSATVYSPAAAGVENLDEGQPSGQGITNPYGWTKAMNEQIIRDVQRSWPALEAVLLRYFNPVGAHSSGLIGEDPSGLPNNLMPFVAQVAIGRRERLAVFGDQYPTHDGTGVRDYIHVMDLAEGHAAALQHLHPGVHTFNLGTGVGHSVLDVVSAFAEASERQIPYEIVAPRPGDVARAVADPSKANDELDWRAMRSLADACRDSWNWQSQNPNGYRI